MFGEGVDMFGMEDFFDFNERMKALTLSGDEQIIKSIIQELEPYNIYDFIARISSLNLLIENQNKAILLDSIIAGLLSQPRDKYVGKANISSGKFRKIIKKLEAVGANLRK